MARAVVVGVLVGWCGSAWGQRERITVEPVARSVLEAPGFVVDAVHFGALDAAALVREDAAGALDGGVARFAVGREVDLGPEAFGSVQPLGGGRIAWRLDIHAEGARSLNIGTLFDVPGSAEVYLLDGRGFTLWGALTAADGFEGEMWSPVIPGEVMRIYAEMDEGDWDRFAGGFRIVRVNIGYRGIGEALGDARSDACHTDVACREADGWCEHAKGVVCYTIDGVGVCSGSMLNTTAGDGRALLYTAFHCGAHESAAGVRAYFNFQNATCRAPGSAASGGEGTCGEIDFGGIPCDTQTIGGASVVATERDADAALLELSSVPPDSFGVVYLGWSVAEALAEAPLGGPSAVGIHHPGVEEKRIAFERDPYIPRELISIGFLVESWVVDFDVGGLEGGSSGSPLLDARGRVVGAVSGADQISNVCEQGQRYGRLEHAWDQSAAFRAALDPVGGGTVEEADLARLFPAGAPEGFGFGPVSPSDGAVVGDTGPNLVWNGACYADSYRVRVSASADLSDAVVDEVVAAPVTSLDLAEGTLAHDGLYYWGVDAMNVEGVTGSETFALSTAAAPGAGAPGAFALLSPADGAVGVARGALLEWEGSPGAEAYLVEVDDDASFWSPAVSEVVLGSELRIPSGALAFNTAYVWRVTAMSAGGSVPASPSVSGFVTAAAPVCPCVGDLDGDCDTDVFDFRLFQRDFGSGVPAGTGGDVDGNGVVDVFDFGMFAMDFGCVA